MLTLAMAMIEQVHMLIGPRSVGLVINILSKSHRHALWKQVGGSELFEGDCKKNMACSAPQSLAAQKVDVFAAVMPKPMRVSVLTYVCKDCCASFSQMLTAISFGPSSCVPSVVSTQ
jgi:hypothetical protein